VHDIREELQAVTDKRVQAGGLAHVSLHTGCATACGHSPGRGAHKSQRRETAGSGMKGSKLPVYEKSLCGDARSTPVSARCVVVVCGVGRSRACSSDGGLAAPPHALLQTQGRWAQAWRARIGLGNAVACAARSRTPGLRQSRQEPCLVLQGTQLPSCRKIFWHSGVIPMLALGRCGRRLKRARVDRHTHILDLHAPSGLGLGSRLLHNLHISGSH
jgi:hypothetical protein